MNSAKNTFFRERNRLIYKHNNLREKRYTKTTKKCSSVDCVTNLSARSLTDTESNLLEKGLNFVPNTSRADQVDILTNVEYSLRKSRRETSQAICSFIKGKLNKSTNHAHVHNLTKDERVALHALKTDDSIVILESDKGHKVVVMNKTDYHAKMMEILNTENYKPLTEDPTPALEKQLHGATSTLFKNKKIDKLTFNHLRSSNQRIPIMYGAPKIHKENVPLRPIVSTCGSTTSNLAKYLVRVLQPLTNHFKNDFPVKDATELKGRLYELKPEHDDFMISFDVQNLFGSIPTQHVLHLTENLLKRDENLSARTSLTVADIMSLLHLCCDNTFFQYNKEFYSQTRGLAMGSPLSPVLAEIYMRNFEDLITSCPEFNTVRFWNRYVDDVFSIIRGDLDIGNKLLTRLNSIDPNLKFTCEHEESNQLSFLDVLITRSSQKYMFSMYSKPTSSHCILNYKSSHEPQVKYNIIKNEVKRILTRSDDSHNDIQNLKTKLKQNGYPDSLVNNVVRKETSRKTTPPEEERKIENDDRPILTLPYLKEKTDAVKRKFRKNTKVVYKKGKTLKNIFASKFKDKSDRNTNAVYTVSCQCSAEYIGETSRDITVRKKEHEYAIRKCISTNGVACHVNYTNHKINWDTLKIIDKETNTSKRMIKEALHIRNRQPDMNLNTGFKLTVV